MNADFQDKKSKNISWDPIHLDKTNYKPDFKSLKKAYLVYENVDDIPLCIYLDEELAKNDVSNRGEKYFSYMELEVIHSIENKN